MLVDEGTGVFQDTYDTSVSLSKSNPLARIEHAFRSLRYILGAMGVRRRLVRKSHVGSYVRPVVATTAG